MDEIRYSDKGLWVEKKDSYYRIGISEQGQDDVGEVAFVELPENQTTIKLGDSLLNVEGAKAVTDLESPLTGTVVRFNKKLEDEPENLNTPGKENNWIVELTDVDEEVFSSLSRHV